MNCHTLLVDRVKYEQEFHKLSVEATAYLRTCNRPRPPPCTCSRMITRSLHVHEPRALSCLASEERPPPRTRPRQRGGSAGLSRRSGRPPQSQYPNHDEDICIVWKRSSQKELISKFSRLVAGWPARSAYDAIAGPDAGRCHRRSRPDQPNRVPAAIGNPAPA
jgi:hypothetical protein